MADALFDVLKEEHGLVASIMDELVGSSNRSVKTREKLFEDLKQKLLPHMRGEEETLYPRLEEVREASELALQALAEHHIAGVALQELDDLPKGDKNWGPKMQVLEELISHHIDEEEDDVFKAAKKNMDKAQLQQMFEDYQAVKERAMHSMA